MAIFYITSSTTSEWTSFYCVTAAIAEGYDLDGYRLRCNESFWIIPGTIAE